MGNGQPKEQGTLDGSFEAAQAHLVVRHGLTSYNVSKTQWLNNSVLSHFVVLWVK